MNTRIAGITGLGVLTIALLAGIAGATTPGVGQNQYGFLQSCNGYIHGAFANTNGNFAWISGLAPGGAVGAATGPANSGAADYCNDLASH